MDKGRSIILQLGKLRAYSYWKQIRSQPNLKSDQRGGQNSCCQRKHPLYRNICQNGHKCGEMFQNDRGPIAYKNRKWNH